MEKVFAQYLQNNKVPFWVRNYARSKVPQEFSMANQKKEDSRIANSLLYFATIIAEYVLLACYLLIR